MERIIQKNKIFERQYPITLNLLGLLIVSVNLGSFCEFAGIKISYFFFIACIISYFFEIKNISFRNKSARSLAIVFGIWAAYALLQFFFAFNHTFFWMFYMILIINIALCLLMLLIIKNKKDLMVIMKYVSIAFAVNIIAAIFEYFTGTIIIPANRDRYAGIHVVAGFIGNYNDFCTFLFLGVVFFLIQIFLSKKRLIKVLYVVGIVISILFMYYNGARGGIYSLYIFSIMLVVFFFTSKLFFSPNLELLFEVLIALLFLVIGYIVIDKIGINKALFFLDNSNGGDINSDIFRFYLIKQGFKYFTDSYFVGVGAGSTIELIGMNVHCFYLEILYEYGLAFGLFVFYLAFLIFIKRKKTIPFVIDIIIRCTGVTMLIVNFTSSSTNKMRMFWIFLMIVFIIKKYDFFDEENEISDTYERK